MGILTYIKLGVAGIVVAAIFGAYMYVTGLQSELELTKANLATSEQNVQTAKSALEQERATLKATKEQFNEVTEAAAELKKMNAKQANDIKYLNDKLTVRANGQSRDLGAITRVKPKLINKIVNKATDNVGRCFELATGAELQPGETNNECKELISTLNSTNR